MQRPRKTLAFIVIVSTLLGGTVALSTYKVAVANAYLRVRATVPAEGEAGAPAAADPAAVATPVAPGSEASVHARGNHLLQVVGCQDCHGSDMGGRVLHDEVGYLTLGAPNLTPHPDAHVAGWDRARWRQALRRGLDAEWRVLWCMPRPALLALADSDVDALVAACQALPPVARTLPQNRLGWRGYLDVALRRLRLIDRAPVVEGAWPAQPPRADEAGRGAYLMAIGRCRDCHTQTVGLAYGNDAAPAPTFDARTKVLADFATWDARLRDGRCPDGRSTAERGHPSRLRSFDAGESRALWQAFLTPGAL